MNEVFILSGVRTPIGSFQGALKNFTAPQLGALAIQASLEKAGIPPEEVDEVLMGCVLTGGLGQAPARQAALGAGLPHSVPCTTINKVCGSGMKTIIIGTQSIKLGDNHIVVAGGMESMTNAPYALDKARQGYRLGNGVLIDTMIHDGLWDPYYNVHMGHCGDKTALECSISREAVDAYASESYRRSLHAQEKRLLVDEIIPVQVPQKKGEPLLIEEDEEPKRGDLTKLPLLKPAFDPSGVTTAGNASTLSDGGAAVVLASDQVVQQKGLKPIGRIVGYSGYAQDPQWFTTAPAFAIEKLLQKHNLTVNDIDLFEVNEAFSVVALVVAQKVGIPHEKLNVNGGAVSVGHPIGMTGTRLVITALHELRRRKGRYAIATPCIGGGEATAVLIEAIL